MRAMAISGFSRLRCIASGCSEPSPTPLPIASNGTAGRHAITPLACGWDHSLAVRTLTGEMRMESLRSRTMNSRPSS